jgi:hypothetical protein
VQSSPLHYYIVPIRPKRLPRHPILEHIQPIFMRSPDCRCTSSCASKCQVLNQLIFTTFRINVMPSEGTSQKGTASSSRRPTIWEIIAVYSTNHPEHTHTNWKYAKYTYFSAKPGGPYTITINYKSNYVEVRLSLCTP